MWRVILGSGLQPAELLISQSPEHSFSPCPLRDKELSPSVPSLWDLHAGPCPLRVQDGAERGSGARMVTSPSREDVEGALSYRAFDLTPRILGVCVSQTEFL